MCELYNDGNWVIVSEAIGLTMQAMPEHDGETFRNQTIAIQ